VNALCVMRQTLSHDSSVGMSHESCVRAVFSDRCRERLDSLVKDPQTSHAAMQLSKALKSISANYAEGYSRSTIADRTRFYEYALGSGRESRDWSFKLRRRLTSPPSDEVLAFLTRITQLLTVTIVRERARPTKRLTRRPAPDA
jgi:four helix bundle protein